MIIPFPFFLVLRQHSLLRLLDFLCAMAIAILDKALSYCLLIEYYCKITKKNHIRNSLLGYFAGNAYFCKWTLWQILVSIKVKRYE